MLNIYRFCLNLFFINKPYIFFWLSLMIISPVLLYNMWYSLFYPSLIFSAILVILLYNADNGYQTQRFEKIYNLRSSEMHIAKVTLLSSVLLIQVSLCEAAFYLNTKILPEGGLYSFITHYALLVTLLVLAGFMRQRIARVIIILLLPIIFNYFLLELSSIIIITLIFTGITANFYLYYHGKNSQF